MHKAQEPTFAPVPLDDFISAPESDLPQPRQLQSARKVLYPNDYATPICEGCRSLDICRQISEDPIRTLTRFSRLDTTKHRGFDSLATLQASATECPSCNFLWPAGELSIRKHLGLNARKLDLRLWDGVYEIKLHATRYRRSEINADEVEAAEIDADELGLLLELLVKPKRSNSDLKGETNTAGFILGTYELVLFEQEGDKAVGPATPFPHALWLPEPDPFSQRSLENIKRWVAECSSHPKCKQDAPLTCLPDRYIDLGDESTRISRITSNTRFDETIEPYGQYVALSYCWGAADTYVLTRSNLPSIKEKIDEEALPSTLRDAFALVRALGIRYLWVDALCIIQDHRIDWQVQSSKMREVYSNACLTVCASQLAVQERMLSWRSLLFGTFRTIWTCQTLTATDENLLADAQTEGLIGLGPVGREPAYRQWNRIVEQYSSCKLTNQDDRLQALSGIAQYFASLLDGDDYLAGHWEGQSVRSLDWYVTNSARRDVGTPSWSWASIQGEIATSDSADAEVTTQTSLSSTSVEPTGRLRSDLYGRVQPDAYVGLRGAIVECVVTYYRDVPGQRVFAEVRAEQGPRFPAIVHFDDPLSVPYFTVSEDAIRKISITALILMRVRRGICGLLVAPVEDSRLYAWRRIGRFGCSDDMRVEALLMAVLPCPKLSTTHGNKSHWVTSHRRQQ